MPDINTIRLIASILLACFPAYIWGYIYIKKQPEPRKLVLLTFMAGILSVVPILLYKLSWNYFPQLEIFLHTAQLSGINIPFFTFAAIPLSVIVAFLIVGIIEEYMKHFAVKMVDNDKFYSINDAIEYSIVAALGFSFIENIMYFYFIWTHQGIEQFFVAFIFRSIFSTFAHILFSGMYGYYYGIAHFSDPIFQKESRENRMWFTRALHKITNIRTTKLFHQEKVIEGLLIAVILHAGFDVFLEIGWTYVILPYLIIGYLTLDYLFEKKEDHINYGRLLPKRLGEKVKVKESSE